MKKGIVLLFVVFFISISLFSHPKYRFENQDVLSPVEYNSFAKADSAHGFDVSHYDISISINDNTHYITGSVRANITAGENIDHITYELANLNVDGVFVNNEPATYSHDGEVITINTGQLSIGEEIETLVEYSGNPVLCQNPYPLGMFFSGGSVFTISDPNASRYWWPCYDHPWDKAIVDLHITMRDDWLVGCNGIRTSIIDNGDNTKTHNWIGENPMATYLVSVTARNFVELNDDFNGVPIQNFVPPSMEANALIDLGELPLMMQIYQDHYGTYPFEKYGNTVTNFSTYGAMEHQTMTTLDSYIITGNHHYATVIAHELSHQWFGDCLTPLTWKDVWLSEGFAVYSEAVFIENTQGYAAMIDYMNNQIQGYYLGWTGTMNHTIYDPPYSSIFTPVTYEKAASVLQALRLLVGTDQFFLILQTYFETYKYGNVITQDFEDVCEDVSGLDLTQFFQQWIYGSGIPSVEYTFFLKNDAAPQLITFARTNSTSDTDFNLTLPVYVNFPADYDSLQIQAVPFEPALTISDLSSSEIQSIEMDRDNWVINRGYEEKKLTLADVYSGDGNNFISWEPFWDAVPIDGYNVYRADQINGEYMKVNNDIITGNSFNDEGVINNQSYFYKVTAIYDQVYESLFTEPMEANPLEFPMDQGILIVDETKDGSGTAGNPTDEMVDTFYANVCDAEIQNYDYISQGELTLDYIKNYSTVIWHDDDLSQHFFAANTDILGSFLIAGGHLLVSGWKTATVIPPEFMEMFLHQNSYELDTNWEFTTATSDIYTDLNIDPDKVSPAFNGTLPYVTVFDDHENPFYFFHSEQGGDYEGKNVGIRYNNFAMLGFPLYFCYEDGVHEFVTDILTLFGENVSNTEDIINTTPKLLIYPNPFYQDMNSKNTIRIDYEICADNNAEFDLFNIKGQRVKQWKFPKLDSGKHSIYWDGESNKGNHITSGIYFLRAHLDNKTQIKKLLLLH